MELVQGGGGREKKISFTTHYLTLISTRYTWTGTLYTQYHAISQTHCKSWCRLHIKLQVILQNSLHSSGALVVDDTATTSLAANDSQDSNDLLVLHSFQEECWQTMDLQYLAQKIFNRDLQLSGFLNLPLFYSLLFLHKYIILITIYISHFILTCNDNCNKMQIRHISNQWKWFGWVANGCSRNGWNEKISSSFSLSHLLYFNTPFY